MRLNKELHTYLNVPIGPVAPCTTTPGSPFSPFVPEGPTGPGSPSRPSLPSLPCWYTSEGMLPHSGEVVVCVGGATVDSVLLFALELAVATQRDNKEWYNHNYTPSYFLKLNCKAVGPVTLICYDVSCLFNTSIAS